jgi:hypothetical protein
MALSIPRYLTEAKIADTVVRYEWDDWDDIPAAETPDDELLARLERVSHRAVFAFGCATAEWVIYRYSKLCDDPAPWQYLETAWAMIVDMRYCGYGKAVNWQEFSVDGWDGPVRRPIQYTLKWLEIAFQQLAWEYKTDPTTMVATVAALAAYVMSDPAPYKKWCGQVLDRFESLYPRQPEDELGDVVPRQAVDPEVDFKVEQTEALVNQFLASLDYKSNPFLSPPEAILEGEPEFYEPFQGKPYVFDIEVDRQVRRRPRGGGHDHE